MHTHTYIGVQTREETEVADFTQKELGVSIVPKITPEAHIS